jgi:hypothetical protein
VAQDQFLFPVSVPVFAEKCCSKFQWKQDFRSLRVHSADRQFLKSEVDLKPTHYSLEITSFVFIFSLILKPTIYHAVAVTATRKNTGILIYQFGCADFEFSFY